LYIARTIAELACAGLFALGRQALRLASGALVVFPLETTTDEVKTKQKPQYRSPAT